MHVHGRPCPCTHLINEGLVHLGKHASSFLGGARWGQLRMVLRLLLLLLQLVMGELRFSFGLCLRLLLGLLLW